MTLADWASLSTALSGFAVTASLIYLAIQTHQNTRNTRALIHQGAAARTTAIRIGIADTDKAAAWVAGNGAEPTVEEVRRLQFQLLCATALDALEDHFLQHEAGLSSPEQFARNVAGFRRLLLEPGMRDFWNVVRETEAPVAPRFCAFVDSLCLAEPGAYAARV
jgi:hypothetical protein